MSAPEPTTAARTVRELIKAFTRLADSGALPRGLDTPVEVGLILDAGTFDASGAFSVEPVTATWPNFRPAEPLQILARGRRRFGDLTLPLGRLLHAAGSWGRRRCIRGCADGD